MVELLTKEEMDDMEKILRNPVFDNDDKRIIERFHKISKNYYNIIEPLRIMSFSVLIITLISIIISIKSLLRNKNEYFLIIYIIFLYVLSVINLQ